MSSTAFAYFLRRKRQSPSLLFGRVVSAWMSEVPPSTLSRRLYSSHLLLRLDYLIYGRLWFPSTRLDALYALRLSATSQAVVSLISYPPPAPPNLSSSSISDLQSSSASTAVLPPSSLELKLQNDKGRWSSEYSYRVDDALIGARFLYNFARPPTVANAMSDAASASTPDSSWLGEDETGAGGSKGGKGLRGRFSAGGEVHFSRKTNVAGGEHARSFSRFISLATKLAFRCSRLDSLKFPPASAS